MDTVLGLLGVVVWIVGTISFAAGITYLVVKIFPGDESLKPTSQE
jgi:hypothetical protein